MKMLLHPPPILMEVCRVHFRPPGFGGHEWREVPRRQVRLGLFESGQRVLGDARDVVLGVHVDVDEREEEPRLPGEEFRAEVGVHFDIVAALLDEIVLGDGGECEAREPSVEPFPAVLGVSPEFGAVQGRGIERAGFDIDGPQVSTAERECGHSDTHVLSGLVGRVEPVSDVPERPCAEIGPSYPAKRADWNDPRGHSDESLMRGLSTGSARGGGLCVLWDLSGFIHDKQDGYVTAGGQDNETGRLLSTEDSARCGHRVADRAGDRVVDTQLGGGLGPVGGASPKPKTPTGRREHG